MSHREQQDYCKMIKSLVPWYFNEKKVLDCGSLDINGSNRYLFEDCDYIGVDLGPGKNVDIISPIHELEFEADSFDTIISTECFEHDVHYPESLKNIVRMLRGGGLFLFTCATTGRREHGTSRTTPMDAPFTNDYYQNLTEADIRAVLDLDNVFDSYKFSTVDTTHDLQFWGIKR